MPVEFLTDEEAASYGRYNGPPRRAELERAFFLDDADKALITRRRGDHSRLGFALQMTTVRSLGLFLADPLDVPNAVLEYLADQLGVADPSCVKRYTERRTTRFEHAEEIKGAFGLRDFADAQQDLAGWVDARAWTTGDGPKAIFNDAVVWLLNAACCCPGSRRWPGWWPRSETKPRSDSSGHCTRCSRSANGQRWNDSWTSLTGHASPTWSDETAARANEVLALNVENLDLDNRRAPIRSKGGETEWVYWGSGTAHLLPRLLRLPDGTSRTSGPLFLSSRRPGPARRPGSVDICPHTGRARLGYDRARILLQSATGWNLHQLRHSAATHLGDKGAPLQLIMAKTRHKSPRTAMRYVNPGPAAVAEVTGLLDPPRRTH